MDTAPYRMVDGGVDILDDAAPRTPAERRKLMRQMERKAEQVKREIETLTPKVESMSKTKPYGHCALSQVSTLPFWLPPPGYRT